MDTHIQGQVVDAVTLSALGSIETLRGFSFKFNDVFPKKICTVLASVANPVLVEVMADIYEPFDAGTSNELSLNTSAGGGVTLINTTDVDPTIAAVQSQRIFVMRENAEIFVDYSPTGTAPTAGSGFVIIRAGGLV